MENTEDLGAGNFPNMMEDTRPQIPAALWTHVGETAGTPEPGPAEEHCRRPKAQEMSQEQRRKEGDDDNTILTADLSTERMKAR